MRLLREDRKTVSRIAREWQTCENDTDNDPGGREPAILYWFEFTPGEAPYFTPHEIDNDSGTGLNLVARDITGDGAIDIVISNKKGVFVFERL